MGRFKTIEEEEKKEEFRQLLKSFLRFYAFVAQVVRLDDTDLEKLSAYGEWLIRLLPTRELPADIEITDDMIRLYAFKIAKQGEGAASLAAGDSTRLRAILDEEMVEMLRNNPPDVVYGAFREAFFKGAINLFQRNAEMKSIVLTDAQAREHATRHFFNRALRAARA